MLKPLSTKVQFRKKIQTMKKRLHISFYDNQWIHLRWRLWFHRKSMGFKKKIKTKIV